MKKLLISGNEAIALGAIKAGVNVATGYPGTPATEVIETIAKYKELCKTYVEWSTNEKVALEVAAGASYTGARSLVAMKQVGLNVASDAIVNLAYIGVKGGLVVVVADDPGPNSSQTEQDTRNFAQFAKVPVFDPSSPKEAYEIMQEAFEYSEKYNIPVIVRPTTKVCHTYESVQVQKDLEKKHEIEGFVKSSKWVIFPNLSFKRHIQLNEMKRNLSNDFSKYHRNVIIRNGESKKGIVTSGVSFQYVMEVLKHDKIKQVNVLKITTTYPFPEKLALQFLKNVDEILVEEELDGELEKNIFEIIGKYNLKVKINGKSNDFTITAGENNPDLVKKHIYNLLKLNMIEKDKESLQYEKNQPSLCAGCPHRASFSVIKQAMKGEECIFCGDIGCYTLGNAAPLDMVDTCLCMGAGITIAQGLNRVEKNKKIFAFIGDSTFFASGITGIINAVFNRSNINIVILDNSTTAMTGKQEHPGTGKIFMNEEIKKIQIENVLKGIGVDYLTIMNPFDFEQSIKTVQSIVKIKGVKVIIFRSECKEINKNNKVCSIDEEKCINCKKCLKELGCPAIIEKEQRITIDRNKCNGCGLCKNFCVKGAIIGDDNDGA